MFLFKNVLLAALCLLACCAAAQDTTACGESCACESRPDHHAPIGVMIDHGHSKGQWMLSYRYMNMSMRGALSGAAPMSSDRVLEQYIMSPGKMTMDMHMLMAMYGITDRITVMAMGSYVNTRMSMDMSMYGMLNMQGMDMSAMDMSNMSSTMTMKDHSSGLGDTKLYVLYKLISGEKHELLLSNGVNLPTGSIALRGNMMGEGARKSYGMQLGTGTYDWLPGLTYTGQSDRLSWGIQATGIVNLGYNRFGYRMGNGADATSWLALRWNNWLSNSLRLDANATSGISGYDKEVAPYRTSDPMANVKNSGGRQATALAGLNLLIPKGLLKGNAFMVEYGVPIYQSVNGIQMRTTQYLYAGWQYAF